MESKFSKAKFWILAGFQIITIGALYFTITLVQKQQKEIEGLEYSVGQLDKQIIMSASNLSYEIEQAKNDLRYEIKDIKDEFWFH